MKATSPQAGPPALMPHHLVPHHLGDRAAKPGMVRRIMAYVRPQAWEICGFLGIIVAEAWLGVQTPKLLQRIVDDGVLRQDSRAITALSLLVILVALTGALTRFGGQWLGTRIGYGFVFRLHNDVFAHLQRLPVAFFTHTPTGELVSRFTNDVVSAQGVIAGVLPHIVFSVFGLAFVLGAMASYSWWITLVVLPLPLLALLPAKRVGRRSRDVSHARMDSLAKFSAFITERFNVAGMLLVQLYGMRSRERAEFRARNARNRDLGIRLFLAGGVYGAALATVSPLAVALVYLFGGHLAADGGLSVGDLIALAALLPRLYEPVNSLATVRVELTTALATFERIFEVLDEPPTVVEQPGAPRLPDGAADVEFDHVRFTYPRARGLGDTLVSSSPRVLHDVSFRIRGGQKVALVGPSGAGKSTIAALLARLYDVDSGSVRVGGHDVQNVDLESLRGTVGVLTQDAHLFHDTIRANLLYARPGATEEQLLAACADARLSSLLAGLPAGLDTMVGDRGYRMSGGEKQRLAIARLLLKAPSIVVLDEATAHLDTASEAAVQQALTTSLAGRTTLIIAHRLSTVRDADEILVLDEGRVAERGTHDQLLLAGGLYARLCRTQLRADDGSAEAVAVGSSGRR